MEAMLELREAPEGHRSIRLMEGVFLIGRNPDTDLVLKDPQVSWHHAWITNLDNQCVIEDLDSTNGTFVEAKRVSRKALHDGDVVSVGPYRMTFRAGANIPSAAVASEQTLFTAKRRSHKTRTRPPSGARRNREDQDASARTGAKPLLTRSEVLARTLPFLGWLRSYRRQWLRGDISAGLTVAAMIIPQGMAYAMLAGLPPIMGLYASILPMTVYALAGTSRQLSVGPTALDSLLVAVGVGTLAQTGTDAYLVLAIALALCVGTIQVVMGITRLGFLVNFLSYPVLCGFTAAAAVITALSQVKHLLGVSLPQTYDLKDLAVFLYQYAGETNLVTLGIGVGGITLILGLKRWLPQFPGPFTVIAITTIAVWLLALDRHGVSVVGAVPVGLPEWSLPTLDWPAIGSLATLAVTLALVGFTQSISVAKSLANKRGEHVDASQELIALGLANIGSSVSQGYVVTGGLSRSAVNARAGAQTPLATLITAALVALTLLYFTPLVYHLPHAALAAIILVSAIGLIDMQEIRYLFRVKRSEGALLVFTCVATLALGITLGLIIGVVTSILLYIILNTRPHAAVLGRLPDTNIFRNVRDFPEAETFDGLVILRIDAAFYFANTEFLKAKIRELHEQNGKLRALVLDASAINDLDSSADIALHQIARDFKDRGIELYIAGVKSPVRRVIRRSGLYDLLGGDHFFFTIDAAVRRYQSRFPTGQKGET